MSRTVIGLFRDQREVDAVVQDLERLGITGEQISIVARPGEETTSDASEPHRVTAKGAAIGGVAGALLGIAALAIPGIGPVLAAGPIAAALTGAGVGAATGGMLGALYDLGVSDREAGLYAEAVRRGGSLIAVEAGEEVAARVQSILDRHGAVDIDEHSRAWSTEDPHTEAANFGDEGGSSQWGRRVLSADSQPSRSRTYERPGPDNRA
jgi:uncharacterized membrane protein